MDEESKKGIVLSSILAISMFMGRVLQTMQAREVRIVMHLQKMTANVMWLSFQGFQHQFWQAVKKELSSGDEYKVNITFVGPETEAQVDKQVEMLRNTLDKNQMRSGFAALDSKDTSFIRTSKNKNSDCCI